MSFQPPGRHRDAFSRTAFRITAIVATFVCLVPAGRCSLRALRIRSGGAATISASANLPANGDMTFRIMLKRNPWDLMAHEILSLEDADGNHRLQFAMNTSPWATAFVSDYGLMAGSHQYGTEGAVCHGCPNGTVFEDWWLVFKSPTATSAGYFRVYRNGGPAPYFTDDVPFDLPIPAGTDMRWKGGPLMLRIGDSLDASLADYQVLGLCWWTAALSDADIAAIHGRQIAGIPDDAVRHLSDIYWYARPDNAHEDRIYSELGPTAGDPTKDAVFSGNIAYTTDTPRVAGWELPDDIQPPAPGPAPLSVLPSTTSISVSAQPGSPDTATRTVVVSKGAPWQYTTLAQADFGPQNIASTDFTGLEPGTTYQVTGQWADAAGNVAVSQEFVRTDGTAAATLGPTHTLHITGPGELATTLDSSATTPLFARMPYESDTTIRLLVRRSPGMSGTCRFLCQRADAAGSYAYARFALGLNLAGNLIARVSDGQVNFDAEASEGVSSTSFDEIWMVYRAPTQTTDGSVELYKGSALKACVPIPAGTDFSWKKWDAQLVLGGLAEGAWNRTIDYEMLEPAWWTKALSSDEMAAISGRPLFKLDPAVRQDGYLYWYARPHFAQGIVEPDLGSSIGATPMRPQGEYTLAPGTMAPLVPDSMASLVSLAGDAPPQYGGVPYTLDDALATLHAAGGLAGGTGDFARLNAEASGDSAGVLDVCDAARIARMAIGLAS